MGGDEDVAELLALNTVVLHLDPPPRVVFLPPCADDAGVEVKVTVEGPLLDRVLDVREDVVAAGVEPLPIRVRVEGEGLSMCEYWKHPRYHVGVRISVFGIYTYVNMRGYIALLFPSLVYTSLILRKSPP